MKKEDALARFKESIALKKQLMGETEQRIVVYYEEFFLNNGHDVKFA